MPRGKRAQAEAKRMSQLYRRRKMAIFKNPNNCPNCFAVQSLVIKQNKDGTWVATCGNCNLKEEFKNMRKNAELIDVYNALYDRLYRNE